MKLTFTTSQGYAKTVDALGGRSFMQVALAHDVPGISADCGGNAMCATCHIYVDEADFSRLPAVSDDEKEMLEVTAAPWRTTSRLACQIGVDDTLGSVSVEVPCDEA